MEQGAAQWPAWVSAGGWKAREPASEGRAVLRAVGMAHARPAPPSPPAPSPSRWCSAGSGHTSSRLCCQCGPRLSGQSWPQAESLASASAAPAVRAALSAIWSPSSRHARSAASPVLPTRASAAHGPPSELTVYPLLLVPRRLARAGEAAGLAGRQEGHRRQHRLGWQSGWHGGYVHPLALVRLLHPDQGPHRPLARAEQVPLMRGGRSTSTSTRYSAVLAAARQCVGCGRGVRGSGCGQDTQG